MATVVHNSEVCRKQSNRVGIPSAGGRTAIAQVRRPDLHPNYIIPVLTNAIKIMRLLENSDRPLNVNEVAELTGVSKSTTYRILRTLSVHGYLPLGAEGVYTFRSLRL